MRRPLLTLLAALAATGGLLAAGPARAEPDGGGDVVLLDDGGRLLRYDGTDAPPTVVATVPSERGDQAWRLAVDPTGDLLVLRTSGALWRVDPDTGAVTDVPVRANGGAAVAVGATGHLSVTDQMPDSEYARVTRTRPDGTGRVVLARGLAHVVTDVLPQGRLIAVPLYEGSVRRIAPKQGSRALTAGLRGWVTDAHRTPDGGLVVATDRGLLRFAPDGTRTRLARGFFTGTAVAPDGEVVASFRFDLPRTRDVEETGGLLRVDPAGEVRVQAPGTFPEDVVVLGESS